MCESEYCMWLWFDCSFSPICCGPLVVVSWAEKVGVCGWVGCICVSFPCFLDCKHCPSDRGRSLCVLNACTPKVNLTNHVVLLLTWDTSLCLPEVCTNNSVHIRAEWCGLVTALRYCMTFGNDINDYMKMSKMYSWPLSDAILWQLSRTCTDILVRTFFSGTTFSSFWG